MANLRAVVNPDRSVTITWAPNRPEEAVRGYLISAGTNAATFGLVVDFEAGNVTEIQTQPGLPAGAVFFVTIAAANPAGPGPRAPAVRVEIPPTTQATPTPTPRPSVLQILANLSLVRAGERLTLTLRAIPPATPVDLYAALLLPEGGGLIFFTEQTFQPFSPNPVPYRRAVPAGSAEYELLNAILDPSVPPGRYALRAAFILSGQPPTLENVVGPLASAEVEVAR